MARPDCGPVPCRSGACGRCAIASEVTAHLPVGIRDLVESAARGFETEDPSRWCDYLVGLVSVIHQPGKTLQEARRQPVIELSSP